MSADAAADMPRDQTVAGLLTWANGVLTDAPGADDIWVVGVASGVTRSRAGHLYWALADDGQAGASATAVLPIVAFGREASSISRTLAGVGVELTDGLRVRVRGRVRVYAPRARVELVATSIDADTSIAASTLARRALLRELRDAGALDAQRALSLSSAPLRVGLVAPPGAGRADVLTCLEGSGFAFRVVEMSVTTEGASAPAGIARAIATVAAQGVDVVVVARGGGARTDLAAADAAPVAWAIARCAVPVVVAVGHSIDKSVADEVSWRSCATPQAAGELLVARIAEAEAMLDLELRAVAGNAGRIITKGQAALGAEMAGIEAASVQAHTAATAHAAARDARSVARAALVAVAVLVVLVVLLLAHVI